MTPIKLFAWAVVALSLASSRLHAQDKKPDFKVPDEVAFHKADIMSEGTRMAAEVFAPKNPKTEKLPTIIMSHGWGGTAAALRPDAIVFAKAGYLVIAFDYRGWGNSDSRLILAGKKPPAKDGKLVAEVKEVREVVDPIDQTTDIMNAIHWAAGEELCDHEVLPATRRIGFLDVVRSRDDVIDREAEPVLRRRKHLPRRSGRHCRDRVLQSFGR